MKVIKQIVVGFLILLTIISLGLLFTGNSHLFKGVYSTYLRGRTGPIINEHELFINRKVFGGDPQPWKMSSKYNEYSNPSLMKEIESYNPAAFLVIKNKELAYEKYWDDFSKDSYTNSFSMAKSFTSILVGAAIADGKIGSVHDLVGKYLEEYKDNKTLTIEHLLTMSSGIAFDESYGDPFGFMAKVYYGTNIREKTFKYPITEDPGEIFRYLGGNTLLLSYIVEDVTGKTLSEYMSEKIWQPIGAENAGLWTVDAEDGVEKAYCCFYSNARDFARIGQLFLNKGKWNGKEVIPSWYVEASVNPEQGMSNPEGELVDYYGYQWWLTNHKGKEVFFARGILGQFILVVPSEDLVVVRLGHRRSSEYVKHHPSDIFHYLDFALEL